MRHYEIVFLVHPDQSDQVASMLDRYKSTISESGGVIHRFEDWGRRQMAYPINKIHKAHYILMNIECSQELLSQLESAFRFNDAILRHLTLKMDHAETHPSPMMAAIEWESRSEERVKEAAPQKIEKVQAQTSAAEKAEAVEAEVEATTEEVADTDNTEDKAQEETS